MKKLSAIILLSCLLCTLVGYRLVFEMRLQNIRSEMRMNMRKGLHAESLLSFSFNTKEASALEWEGESEFRFNGKMYDVISVDQRDGRMNVVCIPDSREEKLIQAYLGAQKKTSDPATAIWLKLANAPYLVRDLSFSAFSDMERHLTYYVFNSGIRQRDGSVQERPPEWS